MRSGAKATHGAESVPHVSDSVTEPAASVVDRTEDTTEFQIVGIGASAWLGIARRLGGMVFCESTDTAKFNGMKLSAIATNAVDQVLAPEKIAEALAALAHPPIGVSGTAGDSDVDDLGGTAILRLLRDAYGIDFSHYKAGTVTRRIERRLALNRSIGLDTYVEQLRGNPRELNSLYDDLLIGVTRFLRDDEMFGALEQRVIPEIIERAKPGDRDEQIRVWTPGCATGQEAYSIAILFHEQLGARRRPVNLKILATDVHKASLDVASAGIYTEQQIAGISPQRREQGEQSIARREGGLGIGLTLMRSLAELHDGHVTVHSDRPGKGSEFTVMLPLAADSVPASASGKAGKRVRTVVLVEDQDDARLMLQILLEAEGNGDVGSGRAGRRRADRAPQAGPGTRRPGAARDERLRSRAANPPEPCLQRDSAPSDEARGPGATGPTDRGKRRAGNVTLAASGLPCR